MKKATLTFTLTIFWTVGICQKDKMARYFGEPILTDTLSTIFLPTRYNNEFLSTNKIAFWGDYYANIVVYNFKLDTYRKLFGTDTYIEAFLGGNNYRYGSMTRDKIKNITTKWVFLLVKSKDYNDSERIDEQDPSTLFVTTLNGENLKALTDANEDVVSFEIFNDQGFGLLKIVRDRDMDKSFKKESIYLKKIDLNDLSFGKEIELK